MSPPPELQMPNLTTAAPPSPSDVDLVIDLVIASDVVTESDSGFVTNFVIASVIATESDSENVMNLARAI